MGNHDSAHEWLRYAEMDLNSAEYLLSMYPRPIEIICYHCQQSAEKYLKGYLVFNGMNPPRTHDLDELCKLCYSYDPGFSDIADLCSDLTAYGVQPRYPAQLLLTEDDMLQAVKSAKLVRGFVQKVTPEFLRKEDCTI